MKEGILAKNVHGAQSIEKSDWTQSIKLHITNTIKNHIVMWKEEWKESEIKELFFRNFLLGSVHGIPLKDINQQLRKLSTEPFTLTSSQKICIPLPRKGGNEYASAQEILEIEQSICELEGFELLKLSHLQAFEIHYFEKVIYENTTRWLEILNPEY
ncbi:hypothetical protein Q73_04350 [Bacillus coahuilensis m2-6]|uniref:hypothetical protein n=1 Tax=Bacillus coahuilensis TaxID=408580 RepID=UPI00018511DE|nr:hypothetical protein [Bacillus coahuilensis]KUP08890.1 hypothetical protein Q73_04350 [Bacillus coahuilensis m2-6]